MHSVARYALKLTAISLLAMASRPGPAFAQALPETATDLAASIVTSLNQGKFASVSAVMHYPPNYTTQQRTKDEASTAEGLKFLSDRLGKLVDCRPLSEAFVGYELSAGGGDLNYWTSVSPFPTENVSYAGRFEHFGKGFLSVRFAQIKSKWVIQTIVFTLDATVAGARDKAIDTSVELIRHGAERDGEPLPPNLRELISAQVPDLSKMVKTPKPRVD